MARVTFLAMTASISSLLGQMSRRNTGLPFLSTPSGSVVRSIAAVPASAKATTSGGEAR